MKLVDDSVVRELGVISKIDVPPEKMLKAALEADLESCVIMGWDKKDDLYFASSIAEGGDVLWIIEQVKLALISGVKYERV